MVSTPRCDGQRSAVQSTSLCDLRDEACNGQSHNDRVLAIAFRPAGPSSPNPALPLQLATTGDDGRVKVWDCETGTLLHTLGSHTLPVHTCSWAPDGRTLATASFDGSILIWGVHDGVATQAFQAGGGVFDVSWNKDGRRLAVSTKEGCAFVLDTRP